MANFNPPFADLGEFRLPTTQERQTGFPCGPADQRLFNGLFHTLWAELGDLVSFAGITPSDVDNTTIRQAVLALIDSATGGNPAGYILMTQARARLPLFPEVLTSDGRIIVTALTNQVRLPGGIDFNHRGIFTVTTAQTDFATDPSKTYHLRWDPTNGFRLLDLAGSGYNPTALAETNEVFDTQFDDMLIARVITNSSNVATITNLANKNRLKYRSYTGRLGDLVNEDNSYGQNGTTRQMNFAYNWARVPEIDSIDVVAGAAVPSPLNSGPHGAANWVGSKTITRYGAAFKVGTDWVNVPSGAYVEVDFRVNA